MKKHIPNTITCCNLISGCIATYFAFMGIYYLALLFIVIGAVFDFFVLHVSSPIGKELDSLADDITFGFAPSAIIFSYLSSFHIHALFVPFLAFVMAAFSALRLAKFNLDERQALGFIGLPTPANALFWGSLIVGLYQYEVSFEGLEWIILIGTFVSCYLLIAEIPMFALKFKHWGWKDNVERQRDQIRLPPLLHPSPPVPGDHRVCRHHRMVCHPLGGHDEEIRDIIPETKLKNLLLTWK